MTGAWELVQHRTGADGAVWRSADGSRFKRTGPDVLGEAAFLRRVRALGYPVPRVLEEGLDATGSGFLVEEALPGLSLHQMADRLAGGASTGASGGVLADEVVAAAVKVSAELLRAQAAHPVATSADLLAEFAEKGGYVANVWAENPDLDTPHRREVIATALRRLEDLPLCASSLDYGLPNTFPTGVIDWQHHGLAPVGYDVAPALEIIAFHGGTGRYSPTPAQRATYLTAVDNATVPFLDQAPSAFLGEFLVIKSAFFLALTRPASASPDCASDVAGDGKAGKWLYRRHLFTNCLEQYEHAGTVDTAAFPTFADFRRRFDSGTGVEA
ncbi:phosphotransferase [Actinomadura harenae]|uniref:Aminoglycoside phosphotransferase n=1 Tax=Actinomadura harenae TaxID=2483351 RepID=A0A3M2LRA2_9ACTN|nr:phosphotransferase [Actinomadura harenae]RMI39969.1 aminoglycoside phosphotransferase [Actinomadura harenae]